MFKRPKNTEFIVGGIIALVTLILGWHFNFFGRDEFWYNAWLEFGFGALLVGIGGGLIQWLKVDRKAALRKLLRNHGVTLVGWILCIDSIISSEFQQRGTGDVAPSLRDQALSDDVREWTYIGFVRTLVIANETAKRVIDIDDAISADTILRLDSDAITALYELTHITYELIGNFQYMITRLAHRDFISHGYESFDPDKAAPVVKTLIKDIDDFELLEKNDLFIEELIDVLVILGEKEKLGEELKQEIDWSMSITSAGVPEIQKREEQSLSSKKSLARADALLSAYKYETTVSLTKALRKNREQFEKKPTPLLARMFNFHRSSHNEMEAN